MKQKFHVRFCRRGVGGDSCIDSLTLRDGRVESSYLNVTSRNVQDQLLQVATLLCLTLTSNGYALPEGGVVTGGKIAIKRLDSFSIQNVE